MRFAHPFARSRTFVPLATFLSLFATALLCAESHAADWPLLPDDFFETSRYLDSVAVDGDTAVVGSINGRDPDSNRGVAFVYVRRDGVWEPQAQLVPSTTNRVDYFGSSVDIDGDTVLVGAFGNNADGIFDSGAAFVFERVGETWEEQARLTSSAPQSNGQFGFSVVLEGDTALIAGSTNLPSAVSVFVREEGVWREKQTLLPAEASDQYAGFGKSLALDGDTALIGAVGSNISNFTGAGYVFVRSDGVWRNSAKLAVSDSVPRDEFGFRVALDGDTALISAPLRRLDEALDPGVYVFGRDGTSWSLLGELDLPGSVGSVRYIGVDGDTAFAVSFGGARASFDLNTDIVTPGDADCGAPAIVAGADRGLFTWQDCADGGIRVLGAGGGESASYRGRIASSGSLTAPSIGQMENGDSATLSASGQRIDFSLTLGGIWYDDFGYFAAEGSCVEVISQSEATGVFVGPNRRRVKGAFDPATGASCTLPETGDTACGAPALGADAAGLYVWQDCDGTWKVLLTGYGTKGGSVGATGAIESAAAITGVQALSLEPNDSATLESVDRVAFELRTQSPWSDAFSFSTVDGGSDVCFRLEGLSETLDIKVGRDQKTIKGASYDAATGGSC